MNICFSFLNCVPTCSLNIYLTTATLVKRMTFKQDIEVFSLHFASISFSLISLKSKIINVLILNWIIFSLKVFSNHKSEIHSQVISDDTTAPCNDFSGHYNIQWLHFSNIDSEIVNLKRRHSCTEGQMHILICR